MSIDVLFVYFNVCGVVRDIYLDEEVILKAPERCDAADIRHIPALVTVRSFPALIRL